MTYQEKTLARILLERKIYKSDGQAFEDLFCDIMTLSNSKFRKIKPWGRIGDRKNDGYEKDTATYYQVYAPEDISTSYVNAVNKINTDFAGLLSHWNPVKNFFFVVNDKFKGVNADCEKTLANLKNTYDVDECDFITSDDLVRKVFELNDDEIISIVGFIPTLDSIENLSFSALNEVVSHIMKIPLGKINSNIIVPDWGEKIEFNKLSGITAQLLVTASFYLGSLEEYLNSRSYLAEELQQHMTGLYNKVKTDFKDSEVQSDIVFWEIVNQCSPKKESMYQNAVITIMAKYFESCDIFEEPPKEL